MRKGGKEGGREGGRERGREGRREVIINGLTCVTFKYAPLLENATKSIV